MDILRTHTVEFRIAHFPRCVKARLREELKRQHGSDWEDKYISALQELGLAR